MVAWLLGGWLAGLLAAGFLAVGCWLLAAGCWLLAASWLTGWPADNAVIRYDLVAHVINSQKNVIHYQKMQFISRYCN